MRSMRIALYVAICAGLLMGFSACGTKGNSNPNPTGPSASLMSVTVSGQKLLTAGTTTQFTATAKYSDGSTTDVTTQSSWSSLAPSFATVNASGVVTAIKPGNSQIDARFQTYVGTFSISVTLSPGTPWSQLPPISDAAKSFLLDYNINKYGAVTRWASFPIPIYADPDFRPQNLVDATNLWQTTTGGKVTFRIVSDPAAAAIVLDFAGSWDNYPDTVCGIEEPGRIENYIILTGEGHYAYKAKPSCAGIGDHRIGLAHGIGHILGLGGHTVPSTDLMSSPGPFWYMSPLLSEIINWLYSVPPGTRPI